MTELRAQAIARAFCPIHGFAVFRHERGVFVHYQNRRAYFACEAKFWTFIFSLSRACHTEGEVGQIERQLLN